MNEIFFFFGWSIPLRTWMYVFLLLRALGLQGSFVANESFNKNKYFTFKKAILLLIRCNSESLMLYNDGTQTEPLLAPAKSPLHHQPTWPEQLYSDLTENIAKALKWFYTQANKTLLYFVITLNHTYTHAQPPFLKHFSEKNGWNEDISKSAQQLHWDQNKHNCFFNSFFLLISNSKGWYFFCLSTHVVGSRVANSMQKQSTSE